MIVTENQGSATVHVALSAFEGRPTSRQSAALMQALLASVLGGDAADWSVGHDEAGAPQALRHGHPQPVFISLSRTDGMAAACFCREAAVGVDIERMVSHAGDLALAETFFSDEERECLRLAGPDSPPPCGEGLGVGVSPEAQPKTLQAIQGDVPRTPTPSPSPQGGGGLGAETFFRIWTLKEAYIKARGLGFGVDLKSFSVATSRRFPELLPAPGDHRNWSLHSKILPSGHALAIATASPSAKVIFENTFAPDQ